MSDIFDFTADFAAEEIADFLLRQNPADILANRRYIPSGKNSDRP